MPPREVNVCLWGACLVLLLASVITAAGCGVSEPRNSVSQEDAELRKSVGGDVADAVRRLQESSEVMIEPYRRPLDRQPLSTDEVGALKALVRSHNLLESTHGDVLVAIRYWFVVGDDRWGVLINGVFLYGSERRMLFAHDQLDFASPQPGEPSDGSHIRAALAQLVVLHKQGSLDKHQ